MDQLSGLRQILREQTVFEPPQPAAFPWIWSICSGKGGTGKSLLAAGAALTLARQGKKVLLLDGDFNLPGLQVFFNHLEISNFFDHAADTLQIGNFISEINSYLHVLMPKFSQPLTSERQMQLFCWLCVSNSCPNTKSWLPIYLPDFRAFTAGLRKTVVLLQL
ncbi:MAG: P-loop NTPase [candidate division KSB1 bacterium]|nr:P-loop NTPase [candidate division KSB1 bacterium]